MIHYQVSKSFAVIALVGIAVLIAVASRFLAPVPPVLSASTTASPASMYLLSTAGACRGPGGYVPCFGGNVSQAEVFNCASEAASAAGCTLPVANASNPLVSFQITIWYPTLGRSNEPSWANGVYESTGDPGQQYFIRCVMTNSTAFIVTEPAPPPL